MSFIKSKINDDFSIHLYKYEGADLQDYNNENLEKLTSASDRIRICFLDTETTGLNHTKDKIIEIALKCIEINKLTGKDLVVIDGYESLQDPGMPIPEQATLINGIKDEDVENQSIDWDRVTNILNISQLVVCHNARFDRPFVDRNVNVSKTKIWACSVNDVDWVKRGFKNRTQELLCIWHGFYYGSHRAMMDVDALIHLLTNSQYQTKRPLSEIINNARKPQVIVFAYNAKIETKDILKENQYRWNPAKKVWHKTIDHSEMNSEREWLTDTIYNGNFTGQMVEITPIDKYKE